MKTPAVKNFRFLSFWTPFALIVVNTMIVVGCAYGVGSGGRQVPGGYRLISVPVFKNSTEETGTEVYFTNAIIREIERAKIGRVTEKSSAQVVLEGTVESVDYVYTNQKVGPEQGLPRGAVLSTDYRILVRTSLALRRVSDQKILWEGVFNGERSYSGPRIGTEALNSVNALYNHSARYQTIQLMATDMMVEAHDRLMENF